MAGLSLSLLLVVGLLAWVVLDDDPYVAHGAADDAGPDRGPGARRRGAQRPRGRGRWRASAERRRRPRGRRRRAAPATSWSPWSRTPRRREVDDFSLRYVDELGAVAEDGTWQAAVDTSWAFRGFDQAPALAEVRFGFRVDGDRAVITSDRRW